MITFERTTDADLIRSIRTHPKIWRAFADDFTGPPETHYVPLSTDLVGHLLAKESDKVLGMFIFVAHNRLCWEIHTCLLPESWGAKAVEVAQELAAWCWRETKCMRVFTVVPDYNRAAVRFAEKAGFLQFGVNEKSIMRNGKLHGQILLGISRPEAR